ncbi:hypothetical protein [Salinactinospora qingdaonensis]|uniref:Asp23/Gls24 family envelope stress response protein n=1 Tax=Salinactinospora qingdaonensis TaxID=702744 RepID=A0ABP7GGY2_9ACTN
MTEAAEVDAEGESARTIAARVLALPDVAALSPGHFHTIATPVAGGRVEGVAVRETAVEVGIVALWGTPLPQIADQVRETVGGLVPGSAVHVRVTDIVGAAPGAPGGR